MEPTAPARPLALPPPSVARPGAALARFMEKRGRPVLEALGTYWWRRGRYFFQSLPPQLTLELDPREVAHTLRARRIAGLRYPTRSAAGEPDALFVCRTAGYGPGRLTRTRLQNVRKGLDAAELRPLDPDELLALGPEPCLQTLARHRHVNPELGEPARWARFVRAVRDCPEAGAVGAFLDGRLSALVVYSRDGAWLHLHVKAARTDDLKRHTSSALDAWLLTQASRDPTLEAVENGALRNAEHLVRYKTSIGFTLEPLRRATRLHPALGLLSRPWVERAAGTLAAAFPRARPLHVLAVAARAAGASAPSPPPRPLGGGRAVERVGSPGTGVRGGDAHEVGSVP